MQGENSLRSKILGDREILTRCLSFLSIVVLSAVFCMMNPAFLSLRNILNLLKDMSPVMVMAAGQAFVLMLGSIDLSTGTMASCCAVMLTVLLGKYGAGAYAIVIVFGIVAGILNGILHAKLGVPSFIATLSTQAIWQSMAYIISGGQPLAMPKAIWAYVDWGKVKFFSCIPLLFIAALIVLLAMSIFSRYYGMGHAILASGANERATWLIGQDVKTAKIVAFMLSSLGACIGGILFAVKAKSGIPTVGSQYNMLSIAAAVMGGVSMSGGRGSIIMTILGALLITMIQNGMNVIGVDALWQNIIFGALLILAIFMNSEKNNKNLVVK